MPRCPRQIKYSGISRVVSGVVLLAILLGSTGCISQLGALVYMIKGNDVAPEYPGLAEKRVAVVCRSDSAAYGPDPLAYLVGKFVSQRLVTSKDEITVVSPGKVDEYLDLHEWDPANIGELGKFCDAEMVLLIEVGDYSIHDGATLYKGRAEIEISVFDVQKDGALVFSKGPDHYAYPENGRPSIQMSERKFEAFYLGSLTNHIARTLITHDKMEGFANEAVMQ